MALYDCPRCNGKGSISAFTSVANGRCFACGGAGKLSASSKALNDAERAGLEYKAHCDAVFARACTDKQQIMIDRLARRFDTAPAKLVAVALGQNPYQYCPEFTKKAVSKAISMFIDMPPARAKKLCHPKLAA